MAEALQRWSANYEGPIAQWRQSVAALHIAGLVDASSALEDELSRLDSRLARHEALAADKDGVEERISGHAATLDALQAEIAVAEQQAGSLATALAAVREHVSDDVCPVCDRDFSELGLGHLSSHLDRKIAQLTDLGERLKELTQQRDSIQIDMAADQRALTAMQAQLLSTDQLNATAARRDAVQVLRDRLEELQPAIAEGDRLMTRNRDVQNEIAELHAAELEEQAVRTELDSVAAELGVPRPAPPESLSDGWRRLEGVASARAAAFETRSAALAAATESFSVFRARRQRADQLRDEVAGAAEEKLSWDQRVVEAKRRQAVAREVHGAANGARSTIVQRVFTESLNEVWRSVFTRLAPREPYVPVFGIPTCKRNSQDLWIGFSADYAAAS